MLSEEQIIERCIKWDRHAQKELYRLYAPVMLGICMRYFGNISEAEDVLQEGFLKVFTKINEFEGKGSFLGWMKKIFINTSINHYHFNVKHRHHLDIDDIVEPIIDDIDTTSEFSQEELMNIINSLPDGYRVVFNLYAIEGYKHKEIAELLHIDINTSKSQYSRARKIIQKRLTDLVAEPIKSLESDEK